MENIMKEEFTKVIKKVGEIACYFYLVSLFFNSKINMKIGYILLLLSITYIFFDRIQVKRILRNHIFLDFIYFFLVGILFNYFSSGILSVKAFINTNGRFLYGILTYIFLQNTNPIYFNASILLAINLSAYIFLYLKIPYFLLDDLGRFRIILSIGTMYSLIFILEKIFNSFKKIILIVFIFLPTYAIIESNSRMVALGFILILSIYLLFKVFEKKDKIILYKILGSILFIVSLTFFFDKNYINHIKTSFVTHNNISNQDRIVMWKAGINTIKHNPILGVGSHEALIYPHIRNWVDKNITDEIIRNEFLKGERFAKLHNMYIDFFVQNGIISLILIVLLFFKIPFEYFKGIKNENTNSAFFTILFYYFYGLTWSSWSAIGISQLLFHVILAWLLANSYKKYN